MDFEKAYSEYYDTVFHYILSLCKDEAWAEEITQEAFFKALKKIESFRGECKLSDSNIIKFLLYQKTDFIPAHRQIP